MSPSLAHRFVTMEAVMAKLPEWQDLHVVNSAENCVYLCSQARLIDGEPDSAAVAQFTQRLTRVLKSGHVNGKLAPVMTLRLCDREGVQRVALMAYMRCTTMDYEQLNEVFRGKWFVDESGLGEMLPTDTD